MLRHIVLFSTSLLFIAACSDGASSRPTDPTPLTRRPAISDIMVRPGVSVRILKSLNGATDSVTAFNDSDVVVGIREQGSTHSAFDWTKATGAQILPTQTGWNSEAFGINDVGTVVGDVSFKNNQLPAQWLGGTNLQTLPVLFAADTLPGQGEPATCVVYGINASGMETGSCWDPMTSWKVAEWNAGTVSSFCSLTLDCPLAGWGYAINSRGVIAGGGEYDLFNRNAFAIYQPATIDTLASFYQNKQYVGESDWAFAINQAGVLAGMSWTGTPIDNVCLGHPAVWPSAFQKPIDVGVKFCGQANGIDNSNDVIGTLLLMPGTQAFIYTQANGTQALPGLGGTNESSQATAINGKREVLGTITSSGVKYDVIWTF